MFVWWLDDGDAPGAVELGGKGRFLAAMSAAGFPVPEGFVVMASAYRRVADGLGVEGLASRLDNGDMSVLPEIRRRLAEAEIPEDIAREILDAFSMLGGTVAVRSSATAEDTMSAAFPGQYETFLGVEDGDGLIRAVKGCWLSLWSDRAVEYREKMGIPHGSLAMAVVVQRLIDPDAAGVMFTADPISGKRDVMVINAAPGLGEAVVSGVVTPDEYRVKVGGLRFQIVQKTVDGSAPVLRDEEIMVLAAWGVAVQKLFGRPQDVEWAIKGGRVYLLQSRPITTLPLAVSGIKKAMIGIISEIMPQRPKTAEIDLVRLLFDDAVRAVGMYYGIAVPRLEDILMIEDGVATGINEDFKLGVSNLSTGLMRLMRGAAMCDPTRWRSDPAVKRAMENAAMAWRLARRDDVGSLVRVLKLGKEQVSYIGTIRRNYLPGVFISALVVILATAGRLKKDEISDLLFAGVSTVVTRAVDQLREIARWVRDYPQLEAFLREADPLEAWRRMEGYPGGKRLKRRLMSFLKRYGAREVRGAVLLSEGYWWNHPETVVSMLVANLDAPEVPDTAERFRRVLKKAVRVSVLPPRLFVRHVMRARMLYPLREDSRWLAMLPAPAMRLALEKLGRIFVDRGYLERPSDIYFLYLSEIESPDVGLKRVAARRRKRYEALSSLPFIRFATEDVPAEGEVLLTGLAGSPGVAEGEVNVILGPEEFDRFKPGQILVAPYTTPSWTPLLKIAAAVVVDTGGPLSHAAIVAREFGIPAVMGTGNGTKVLRSGVRVRVDGGRGLVLRPRPSWD